jgi:hypothetical protein
MNLTELTYISKSHEQMGMISLMSILEGAIKWNQSHGITGVLFYENGYFCQLLEGDKQDILDVWDRISSDGRHIIVRKLDIRPIEKRRYPNWKLRFYGAEQIATHFKEISSILDGMPDHDPELLQIMRTIVD